MKKWLIRVGVTCAAVLTCMVLFSTLAQADTGKTPAPAARQGHVEILDVTSSHQPLCAPREWYENLINTVEAQSRELAARLSAEGTAALLQDVLVIDLPGHQAPANPAPYRANSPLVGVAE